MFGGYNLSGSPPLPDIIGPYYSTGANFGLAPDMYGGGPSTGYLYDPITTAGIYGSTSPIRRRRYSIAGIPSATMMNDYYSLYPSPLQHASSSNIVNLLNETHKSISRSSQILNQNARLQQAQQPLPPTCTTYAGRAISSYPSLHPGGEISPPYLSDTNLLQMSNSFSSQPNMYFQSYTPAAHLTANTRSLLRPAHSVSNLNANLTPYASSRYTANTYPYTQSLLNHSDLPYILQQRQLYSSLHASNPAISQYYQQQLPHYLQPYAQPYTQHHNNNLTSGSSSLAYNLQQQFAGTQNYPLPTHPTAHLHHNVAQQLNPNHQFHVHTQQNHMQTHPLASMAHGNTPFGVQLTSSDTRHDNLSYQSIAGGNGLATSQQLPPTHHHHHPHVHHPTAPHTHHLPPPTTAHHHHHHQHQHNMPHHTLTTHTHAPYTKLDLDYPKLPQEHKRQVSFKFDVDQLSLDS